MNGSGKRRSHNWEKAMALDEFWRNVRAAARFIRPSAIADSPSLDATKISKMLESSDFWLAPAAVRGYVETDFSFLAPGDQQQLSDAVELFRAVAQNVNPKGPATPEQVAKARPAFQSILELLEFHRYGDAEAFRLGKIIEQKLTPLHPAHLDHLRFRTGLDSTGDPALWVWGYVAQTGEYDETTFLEWADDIRRVVDPICREFAPEGRAFLYFRSTAEQAELEGAAA